MQKEKIIDDIKWYVKISSSANIEKFAQEKIEQILFCYKYPEYQEFRTEHTSKIEDDFDEYSVAQWQVKKLNEIEKKFFDNLKYEIKDNILSISIELEINFTESFDKGDVISWVEGLHRLNKIYSMIGLAFLKKDAMPYDEYQKGFDLLDSLNENEEIEVYKEGEEKKETKVINQKSMKYIKGNQTYKLDDCEFIKLRFIDNEDFVETPWGKRFENLNESVLANHALGFMPFHSWGAIIPSTGTFNFIETLEKGELVLHPEAWDSYIENGVIDQEGNYIYNPDEYHVEDEDCNEDDEI